MKISNLRAKFKPKGCKGNLHFGKVILTLVLICTLILRDIKYVWATDLYDFDKYTVYQQRGIVFAGYGTIEFEGKTHQLYSSIEIEGDKIVGKNRVYDLPRTGLYKVSSDYALLLTEFKFGSGERIVYGYEKYIIGTKNMRGKYVGTVIGTYNQYPTDGIHSDGYWYVRRGLANKNPEITISTPTENSYFV